MGVDIHCFIEKRNKDTNQWEELVLYKDGDDGSKVAIRPYEGCRNSELFGLLAGASNFNVYQLFDGCLVPCRGLPNDLSDSVKAEYGDGEYYFCETWYDYCELNAYVYTLKMTEDIVKNLSKSSGIRDDIYDVDDICMDFSVVDALDNFFNDINYMVSMYEPYDVKPNDIRIVMWFDH